MDAVVLPAEVLAEGYPGTGYKPTTLVMTFPAGELDELRRLIAQPPPAADPDDRLPPARKW